ncbi:MAG TPA: lactonase family protein [Pyrinomonadaceae bacterium]|nr:lactonase family protein [Pyrinomonadaceae bacterium]
MTNNHSTRRGFLKAVGSGTLGLTLSRSIGAQSSPPPRELLLYVGTYTAGKSEGIYVYRMDLSTGALKLSGSVKANNPSFLAVDERRRYVYAVNEVTDFDGRPSGAVSAFSIDQATGNLRFLNQQPSLGGAPCYVSVARGGRFVLVANYVGGNVSVLPVRHNGQLGKPTDVAQHRGSGANAERQDAPHAHSVVLDQANRFAFAADLGIDRVMVYRFDARRGTITPNKPHWFQSKAGAGPRHFTFHPNGRHAYVINELDSTITALAYEPALGRLTEVHTVSSLPKEFSGANTCADVHLDPSGSFLYGSNRGHDSIVVLKIERDTGRLHYVEHVSTEGKTPRNFTIDPTGGFLLAANQNSDTIVTFRRDAATGRLRPAGHVAEAPSPVCLELIHAFPK